MKWLTCGYCKASMVASYADLREAKFTRTVASGIFWIASDILLKTEWKLESGNEKVKFINSNDYEMWKWINFLVLQEFYEK